MKLSIAEILDLVVLVQRVEDVLDTYPDKETREMERLRVAFDRFADTMKRLQAERAALTPEAR